MFNKDKQPTKIFGSKGKDQTLSVIDAKPEEDFDVHVMPTKFLSGKSSTKSKSKQDGIGGPTKVGLNMKKNIIWGAAIVIILGVFMVLAAWLFLKSIDQKPSSSEIPPAEHIGELSPPQLIPSKPTTTQTTDEPVEEPALTTTIGGLDSTRWETYSDDDAYFSVKYPHWLLPDSFQSVKYPEIPDIDHGLALTLINLEKLDEADRKIILADQKILNQGQLGTTIDWSLEASRDVMKINDKYIKTFTILEQPDTQEVIFERMIIFYHSNHQVIISFKGDQLSIMADMPDSIVNQKWITQSKQETFYDNLIADQAPNQAQEWYDLFEQIISTLEFIEPPKITPPPPDEYTPEPVQPERTTPQSSQDYDGDGLTDVEEETYSTQVDKPDTDQDGYLDGNELGSLYSPIKPKQKLETSGLVKKYANSKFGYMIFYPAVWNQEELDSNGETVMFTSETTEFIEVIVQENLTGINNIRAWYLGQIQGTDPSKISNIMVGNLVGVRSSDKMNIYFMKDNLIYTLSYNINLKETANFMKTFEMMVKSFKLFENPLDQ